MNIAKKLLFSLLLCGTVFAAACGEDTGDKAKENEACSATLACDTGLGCVATTEGAEKGTCKKTCTGTCSDQNQECKATPKVKDATDNPKICQAKGSNDDGTEVAVGQPCTKTNKCISTAVCVLANATDASGTCQVKCDAETPEASDCTEQGKKACVSTKGFVNGAVGDVLTCVASSDYYGGNAVPVGKKCSANATCKDEGACVTASASETVGTCTAPCAADSACSGETPLCLEAPTQLPSSANKKICSPKKAFGAACTKSEECKDGSVCVDSLCAKECTDNTKCDDTGAATTCSPAVTEASAKEDAEGNKVQVCIQ